MGTPHSCLPLASEAQYREYVDAPAPYRQYLRAMLAQYPALFPQDMDLGCPLHDADVAGKQDRSMRRITWSTTGAVFTLRPSVGLPYMMARPDEVEKALSLRQWGGPCDARASVLGREAMGWSRAWLAFGRPALVGTTGQAPHQGPRALVAEEQLPQVAKPQGYVPPIGGGCFWGVRVVEAADTGTLARGEGECAPDAPALDPPDHARSVCPDGWEAPRQAWRQLCPQLPGGLGFLPSLLQMQTHCAGPWRHQILDKAGQV